jgi:hypothetical protein
MMNATYKVTIHTTIGFGGKADITIYDAVGYKLGDGAYYGSFKSGDTDVFYITPSYLETGAVDHVVLTQTDRPITSSILPVTWLVGTIEVTDLRTNSTVTLTANKLIPFNTEVTIR